MAPRAPTAPIDRGDRGDHEHTGATPRVVVTGLGAVTPFGWGVDALRTGLFEGRAAFERVSVFPIDGHRTELAGQVPEGGAELLATLLPRQRKRLSRTDTFAVAAALEAVGTARLDTRATDVGVFLGSSTGGMFEGERFYWDLLAGEGPLRASRIASHQNNGPTDAVARVLGLGGPAVTLSSACSAASMALEAALHSLAAGEVDVALAGGSDALCQLTYAGFNALRAIDEGPCQPFRAERRGLSLGEGAGVLVLETEEHARARGATVVAELAGAGSSCDAHHMTAPAPDGAGLALAIEKALADAGLEPHDVDVVNAHGTGTPLNDEAEWQGLTRVFGAHAAELVVMATKGAVGHLLGACGAVEAVASVLALDARAVPPTPGAGPVDPACPAGLVFAAPARPVRCATVLSVNLAFGGANAAVVFRTRGGPA